MDRPGSRAKSLGYEGLRPVRTSLKRDQPSVGDGDAMGVTRQVLQDLRRSSKRRFDIDDPVVDLQLRQQPAPVPALGQCFELPVKAEQAAF